MEERESLNTSVIQDYLKAIYQFQEAEGNVSTTALAKHLKIAPASVSGMIKKLFGMNLVDYKRYYGVVLTVTGKKIALETLRHHRLVELYLAKAMGISWDRVHPEAEKWEHVLSEELEEKMDEMLGHPVADPHGAPIPPRRGNFHNQSKVNLAQLKRGHEGLIGGVSDEDPELLRYLGSMGLYPNVKFSVMDVAPYEGPVTIKVGNKAHVIGQKAASHLWVKRIAEK